MTASPPDPGPTDRRGRLLRALLRHSRGLLAAAGVLAVLAGVFGHDLSDSLSPSGNTAQESQSARADKYLTEEFGAGSPQLVLLARADTSADDPAVVAAGRALTEEAAAAGGADSALSYWSAPDPALRSADGRAVLVLVRFSGTTEQADTAARDFAAEATGQRGPLRVTASGESAVRAETQLISSRDLSRGELVALPLTLLILLVVFRSAVAAVLPLLVGVFAVLCTTAALQVVAQLTTVSVYALNITTALGFALAVDYSLFLVTRFREELAAGAGTPAAVATTWRTVGRAVLFSGLTVALSMSALLLFDLPVLRSIGLGGVIVTLFATLGSTLLLPAVLGLLGRRVDALDVTRLWRRTDPGAPAEGHRWARLAHRVMRRPLLVGLPLVAVLGCLAVPFTEARFGLFDDRVLPASSEAGRAAHALRADFDSRESVGTLQVAVPGMDAQQRGHELDDYADRLSELPGASGVQTATGDYRDGERVAGPSPASLRYSGSNGAWLAVDPSGEPYGPESGGLAREIRTNAAPEPVLVSGPGAVLADVQQSVTERLPLALTMVVAAMLVLVTALTGSPFLALKALVLNSLSLTATFGALVHIFQEGNLQWLVGEFTATGMTDSIVPALVFCIAFGISMDYEILLLSRITEEYRRTRDTNQAVAAGLQHTGRLFTSAAVVFAVVMLVLATSDVVLLKIVGFGLALAVLLDATLIRALLVPSCMRLAGRANWWCPWRRAPAPAQACPPVERVRSLR